ncbi:hypothetical protein ACTG0T_08050 [Halococcus morrhuae DSM 1307]|uniref:hypothetical protein n=1 Tax=Halococcus morrhuae TaxID=2250 RepID=UPI0012670B2F|nr:hypothetical protein [Halococcus morrhuae]
MFSPQFYVSCLNSVYSSDFDEFEELNVDNTDNEVAINGYEYDGEGMVNIIEGILEEQKSNWITS